MRILSRGTQVIYKPDHIDDLHDFDYPNGAQPGFVSSEPNANGDYFVRYWVIKSGVIIHDLRTKANSECTPARYLTVEVSVPSEWVTKAMQEIEAGA